MEEGLSNAFASLLQAAHTAEAFLEGRLQPCGLSVAKLAALQQLMEAGGSLPLGQLAERLECVKSNVTQLVDRLETDGFVTRAPDPNDRRTRLAVITPAGRMRFEEGRKLRLDAESELVSALSADEARQLAALAEKLATGRR
jgi:DNA-binding MarR family transcriptional regulator